MGGSNKEKRKGTRSSPGRKTPTVVNYGRAPAPTAAGGSEGCGALGGPLPGGPFHPPGPATALAQPQRGGGKAKTPGSCCSPDGSRAQDLGVGGGKRRAKSKRAARASVPMEPVAASGGGGRSGRVGNLETSRTSHGSEDVGGGGDGFLSFRY